MARDTETARRRVSRRAAPGRVAQGEAAQGQAAQGQAVTGQMATEGDRRMRWGWTKKEVDPPSGSQDASPLPFEPIFPPRPAPPPQARLHDTTGPASHPDAPAPAPAPQFFQPADPPPPAAPAGPPHAAAPADLLVAAAPADASRTEAPATALVPPEGVAERESEALLEALYPLLLRRAVDEHGRRNYGATLRKQGIARGVVPVLRSMLDSEEHRAVAEKEGADAVLRRDVAPVFGPVQHVASLGTSCYPAWLMQRCGLKRWSGPFDWIFGGVDMVTHCLEDDFATFLDETHLRALGDGRSTHGFYGPAITVGPVFNHRDVTLPEHRAYTERCVVRFRALLESAETKCFVMVVAGHRSRPDSQLVGDFARLVAALGARTGNFRLLMVSHDQSECGLASSLREVETRSEGSLFRFRSASAMQAGLSFRQEWDNLVLKRLLWSNSYDLRDAPG